MIYAVWVVEIENTVFPGMYDLEVVEEDHRYGPLKYGVGGHKFKKESILVI